VTRGRFETEFEAYKKIFEDLAEVRLLMPALRPLIEVTNPNEDKDDKLERLVAQLADLEEGLNTSVRTIENLGPFIRQTRRCG
jgi:hypothetical protein